MADQQEMVAIRLSGKGSVYHKTRTRDLGDRIAYLPICEGLWRIRIVPLSEVGNRRLCKRCERMEESDA